MITEKDLMEAIAECQGVRNPTASTCLKLASYYTILEHMKEKNEQVIEDKAVYSYSAGSGEVTYYSESEFGKMIYGRDADEMWKIMDELMDSLKVVYPRLYDSVMRKID